MVKSPFQNPGNSSSPRLGGPTPRHPESLILGRPRTTLGMRGEQTVFRGSGHGSRSRAVVRKTAQSRVLR